MHTRTTIGFCAILLLFSGLAASAGVFGVSVLYNPSYDASGPAWIYTLKNLAPLDSGTSPAELWFYWPDPTDPEEPDKSMNPPDYDEDSIVGTPADWAVVPGNTCPNWYATDDRPYPQQNLSGFAVRTGGSAPMFKITYYDGIEQDWFDDTGAIQGTPEPSALSILGMGFALAGPLFRRSRRA